MRSINKILALGLACFCFSNALAVDSTPSMSSNSGRLSESFVEPRAVEEEWEYLPHFGLLTGVANPRQGFGAAVNYGLDFGIQPFIPFSVGFELSRYKSSVTLPEGEEKLARTKAMVRAAYNFGGDIPILRHTYLGLSTGPIFENRAGNGSIRLGLAPLAGFDVRVVPMWSAGLSANYLIVTGRDTPNAWNLNGALKYWF
jgi:hypothetical protein